MPASSARSARSTLQRLAWLSAVALGASLAAVATMPGLAGATGSKTTIKVTRNATWGSILTLGDGATVYRLTADKKDRSSCAGQCASVWPPVLLEKGQSSPVGEGVSGLGSFVRSDGVRQVTFDGIPLYTYSGDHKAGQVNGNLKDTWGQWWAINPAHPTTAPAKASSATSSGTGIAY